MNQKIQKEVSGYANFPNYSIQLDKGGCRVQLIGNDIPLYTAFEQGGFSTLLPFNANILQSGEQTVTIKIYPDAGKTTFDDYTNASIKVVYFEDDKNKNSARKIVQEYKIPKEVIDKKLNYFEASIKFKATVPFNFSKQFESAKDLKKRKNIETEVVAAYHKIHSWLAKKDVKSLADFRKETDKKACLAYYLDTEQEIEERFDYTFLFENNSKADPLPKYTMTFYAGGKLVRLERIDNHDEILTVTGKTEDGYEVMSDLSVLLYMPEGSEELKQF
ncbi:hypothetical protein [Chryseobacterium vrystaatense]|nr:hypothetical protein [Chryseobacterium vrystaatense]KFF25426.1 hypothetical protein IW16_15605 [Chryseobacterium vrystaatense]